MAADQMEVAALGRPFALGMLYDARKDKLNTGEPRIASNEVVSCFIACHVRVS